MITIRSCKSSFAPAGKDESFSLYLLSSSPYLPLAAWQIQVLPFLVVSKAGMEQQSTPAVSLFLQNDDKTGYLLLGKKKNMEKNQERKQCKSQLIQQINNKENGLRKIDRQHNQPFWYQGVKHLHKFDKNPIWITALFPHLFLSEQPTFGTRIR